MHRSSGSSARKLSWQALEQIIDFRSYCMLRVLYMTASGEVSYMLLMNVLDEIHTFIVPWRCSPVDVCKGMRGTHRRRKKPPTEAQVTSSHRMSYWSIISQVKGTKGLAMFVGFVLPKGVISSGRGA